MATRDNRLVDNQRSFRSASDRLQDIVIVEEQRLVPFLCRCAADVGCTGRIHATVAEFGAAHEGAGGSSLLPGHARVVGEKVLSSEARFEIVSRA